jgi:hypothetical protein
MINTLFETLWKFTQFAICTFGIVTLVKVTLYLQQGGPL